MGASTAMAVGTGIGLGGGCASATRSACRHRDAGPTTVSLRQVSPTVSGAGRRCRFCRPLITVFDRRGDPGRQEA